MGFLKTCFTRGHHSPSLGFSFTFLKLKPKIGSDSAVKNKVGSQHRISDSNICSGKMTCVPGKTTKKITPNISIGVG